MSIEEEVAFSTFLQELSARLAAASANAEPRLPRTTDTEIKRMSESIQMISSFLKDAKAKDRKNNVRAWLRQLTDVVNDIDRILQLFSLKGGSYKILALSNISKMSNSGNGRANPKIALEVKAIRMRLDKILKKVHSLSLQHRADHGIANMAISHSPVETLTLSGKNEDQEKITELLLSAKETEQLGPCIVSIAKKGEARTTELARAIFDDKRVANHFSRTIWVNASEAIDSAKLSRLICKPASTIFWVHKTLDIYLEEEQVLLILDNIKNKNVKKKMSWLQINHTGTKRKTVISTSHFERSAVNLETVQDQEHSSLSAKDSWMVFKECAFVHGNGNVNPQLESIGRNIVKNLEGSRSMIKMIGGILSFKLEPSYWKLIMESKVWKLPVDEILVQLILANFYNPYSKPARFSAFLHKVRQ